MIYKGTLNRTMFALYLDQILLPKLPSESVLVMDNLPCHKGKEIEAVAAKHSISIMYLPAYSPELNPIEKCWSHTKKEVYRIFDSLVDNFFEVLKEVLNIFTLSEDSVPTF